jgi:hypothetical protein
MPVSQLNKVIQQVRTALEKEQVAGLLDAVLLKRYVQQRDDTAFEA